jgi:hypothetical protein
VLGLFTELLPGNALIKSVALLRITTSAGPSVFVSHPSHTFLSAVTMILAGMNVYFSSLSARALLASLAASVFMLGELTGINVVLLVVSHSDAITSAIVCRRTESEMASYSRCAYDVV